MSITRHLQTDGASEVMNRMVENFLGCYCEYKQNNWDMLLPAAEFAYNSARSEDFGASPFKIDLEWKPRDPLDLITAKSSPVGAIEDFKTQLREVF